MTWVRIDDHFDEHPKLAAVGPVGWGVWLAGLAYCNRNLTDGFIPYAVAEGIGGSWRVYVPDPDHPKKGDLVWTIGRGSGMHGEDMETQWVIDLLLLHGLWDRVPGGFRVHDFDDYQPTKAEVMEERNKNKDRQAEWRKRSRNKATHAVSNAATNGVTNRPVTGAPYPVPVPGPEPVSQVLSNVPGTGEPWVEPADLYATRARRKSLSQKERDWLEDLHVRFSRSELVAALKAVPPGTDYLKRVDAYLEGRAAA